MPEQPNLEQIKAETFQKIHEIEDMLLKYDARLPGHLQAIHKNLIQYDELPHLLSDEQIHSLIKGQSEVTGKVITNAVVKSSKASLTKQAKSISAEDL